MSDERDDLVKEIGDTLRIEPSPSFAAGVRTRIANEPAPSRWTSWLMWTGATVRVAAAAVATFAISRPAKMAPAAPASTPVVAQAETPVVSQPVVPEPPTAARKTSILAQPSPVQPGPQAPAPIAGEPFVQVQVTGQAVLAEMWSRALQVSRGNVAEVSEASASSLSADAPLPELKELVVEPLVVSAIQVSGATSPGSTPVIRRAVDGVTR